jgi:hypothetical protein
MLRFVESHVIPVKAGVHLAEMGPRFRGGGDGYDFDFHALGAGPRALSMTACARRVSPICVLRHSTREHEMLKAAA